MDIVFKVFPACICSQWETACVYGLGILEQFPFFKLLLCIRFRQETVKNICFNVFFITGGTKVLYDRHRNDVVTTDDEYIYNLFIFMIKRMPIFPSQYFLVFFPTIPRRKSGIRDIYIFIMYIFMLSGRDKERKELFYL